MAVPKLFHLPGRDERRTIIPQFLAPGANQAPHVWDQSTGRAHATKRLHTLVPTLSFAAWLKSVDAVHADTIHVRGAVIQDQVGTIANPALHLGWGTPWIGALTLWDCAYNLLPRVGRRGARVGMEAAKWSAQTEIGPWGANYGDSLVENTGMHNGKRRRSSVRITLAEAMRFVMREQQTGQPIDPELVRHGVELMQAAISQAADVAGETIESKNVESFFAFITENGIAPRGIDLATGQETDFGSMMDVPEQEWAPYGFKKKSEIYDYSDEAVERERELWLPPDFREQAKVTVETLAETNKRPPVNMTTDTVGSLQESFETMSPAGSAPESE